MAWVHGVYRKRRRVNDNTRQETSEADRCDGDLGEHFELGGRLKSEPNLTVNCVRITRELLLLFVCFYMRILASFCSSPFWDRRSGTHLRVSLSCAPPWCPHPTHVGASA